MFQGLEANGALEKRRVLAAEPPDASRGPSPFEASSIPARRGAPPSAPVDMFTSSHSVDAPAPVTNGSERDAGYGAMTNYEAAPMFSGGGVGLGLHSSALENVAARRGGTPSGRSSPKKSVFKSKDEPRSNSSSTSRRTRSSTSTISNPTLASPTARYPPTSPSALPPRAGVRRLFNNSTTTELLPPGSTITRRRSHAKLKDRARGHSSSISLFANEEASTTIDIFPQALHSPRATTYSPIIAAEPYLAGGTSSTTLSRDSFPIPPLPKSGFRLERLGSDTQSDNTQVSYTSILAIVSVSLSFLSFVVSLFPTSPGARYQLIPASPVHLLHPSSLRSAATDYLNALLSVFLLQPYQPRSSTIIVLPGLVVGLVELYLLHLYEKRAAHSSRRRSRVEQSLGGLGLWSGVLVARIGLAWVFGRGVGYAWPEVFSTAAISSVSRGLAPLLLTLHLMEAIAPVPVPLSVTRRLSLPTPSISSLESPPASAPQLMPTLLLFCSCINFSLLSTPLRGVDAWWTLSAVLVGLAASGLGRLYKHFIALSSSSRMMKPSTGRNLGPEPAERIHKMSLFLLLCLPILSFLQLAPPVELFSTSYLPSSSLASLERSFAELYPSHQKLFTILMMTAPRPGEPDLLIKSLESWLGAFPVPETAIGARIKIIVYTHFPHHPQFDASQAYFLNSKLWQHKAASYIEWRRDPRCLEEVQVAEGDNDQGNRLDQRLHLARGLDYASRWQGPGKQLEESAYVLLTEDDFPLCPDQPPTSSSISTSLPSQTRPAPSSILYSDNTTSYHATWEEIMRITVGANEMMPDTAPPLSWSSSSHLTSGDLAGHCGVFFATGGSGLLIRTFIARRLPALLLGEADSQGIARVAHSRELERLYGLAGARDWVKQKEKWEGADTPDVVIQDCLRGRLEECRICAPPLSRAAASVTKEVKGPWSFPAHSARTPFVIPGDRYGKSGLAASQRLLQHHLGYNTSTLPGRSYGVEEWACGWRQPFNGEPDVLTL